MVFVLPSSERSTRTNREELQMKITNTLIIADTSKVRGVELHNLMVLNVELSIPPTADRFRY